MKDGEAFASKYDSQQLKIRVPNVVMVFSNSPPDVSELAKVRFRIFCIDEDRAQNKKDIIKLVMDLKTGNNLAEMEKETILNLLKRMK